MNPIKSQGQCGCCYAFAAVGVLEAAYYLKYGQLLSFSEQYIVSCDNQDGAGCNGGDPNFVADWVSSNGGIPLETSYPYAQLQNPNTVSCTANAGSLIPITLAADNVYYGPTLNTIEVSLLFYDVLAHCLIWHIHTRLRSRISLWPLLSLGDPSYSSITSPVC